MTPVSKTRSLTIVVVAYVLAVAVGAAWLVWGPDTGRLWLDTLIADVLATLVVFAFSRAYGNSSFYDAYWSVIPPLLLVYWWSQGDGDPLRCWLVAVLVVVWAVRLTGNWCMRFPVCTTRIGATRCSASGRAAGRPWSIWWPST